jgi:hypothetical protein
MTTSKTTQTSNQKTDPWAPAVPALQQGLSAAGDVYNQRKAQTFFPGKTYAGFSNETESALSGMADKARSGTGLTAAAGGMVGKTLSGDYLSAGNPYFSQMSDRITSEVLPSITAQWARAGRGTGNGEVVTAASKGLGDAIGNLAYQNYSAERNNQMQAASMAPTLDYADLERLRAVGAEREQMAQQGINEDMARYQYGQDQQANALREFQGFTMPVAQLGQQSSGTSTTSQQQSPLQTAVGAGLMGASLFGDGGPLAGMIGGKAATSGLSAASQAMMKMPVSMMGGYYPDPRRPHA